MLWPPYVLLSHSTNSTLHCYYSYWKNQSSFIETWIIRGKYSIHAYRKLSLLFFLLAHSYFYLALSLFFLKNVLSPSCSVYLLVMNSRSFCGKQKALLCFWNMFCVVQPLEKCIAPCFLSERWRLFHCLLTHVVSDKKLTDIRNCSFLFIVTYSFSGCF